MVLFKLLGIHDHTARFDPGTNISYMHKSVYEPLKRWNPQGVRVSESIPRCGVISGTLHSKSVRISAKARIPCYFPFNDTFHIITFLIVDTDLPQTIIGNDSRYKILDTCVKAHKRWDKGHLDAPFRTA